MQFAAFALAALASAGAAPPTPPDVPPAVFETYGHAEITADNCKSKDPTQTVCFIPPKTMGRYLVEVAVKATATGPDAAEAIAISGQGWVCGERSTKKGDWTSGARVLVAQCIITVLSDNPVPVVATVKAVDSTLDPAGPKMVIRRAAWNGVIDAGSFQAAIAPPPKAAGAKSGPAEAGRQN